MFNFLKEKLKSWLGKSKEKIEEKAPKKQKAKIVEKPKKKEETKEPKKQEKKKRTSEQVKEERKVTEQVFKDIGKEKLEIKTPEEKFEKVIREEAAKEEAEKVEEKQVEEIREPEKKGFFAKLKSFLSYQITEDDFNSIFEDLEMLLLENNVALEVVEEIKKQLKEELINKEIKKNDLENEIKKALKKSLENILIDPEDTIKKIKEFRKANPKIPYKILFFGINGAGKTTSIARLTNLCLKNKLSCVIGAADTFRAAAIEQIQIHADRLGVKLIKSNYQADPSSVAFDSIKYAETNNLEVVLIDTAGRMHTKENLLHEMEKICRVTKPNLKVFVAEAIAGNDATEQAKAFNDMIGIDGSILTKTDVDEKGGTIISISFITKKPILYLGVGQKYDDLELFNKENFIKRLGL